MAKPGISIESIAAWYAEAARNRREQHRRRRGRRPRKTEQRDWLESDSPARRSGNTPDVESVHEPGDA